MSFYNFAKCLVTIVFKGFYKIKYVINNMHNITTISFYQKKRKDKSYYNRFTFIFRFVYINF